uniref:RNase H type-1 domain-containing protein n=1 Tax=Aegilops tauschii subsp. strangulata TaxID=200361 RepID=A0A452XPQ8_AEGTS
LMESLSHDQFVLLAVTLWAIWTARRKEIHKGIFQTPQATTDFVRRFIAELEVLENRTESTARGGPPAQIRPRAPPAGWFKIHVDAGVRTGRGGSAAAICRDQQGNYLGSSALVIAGVDDPAILETIACHEELALAEDLNLNNLIIASDAKQVVSDNSVSHMGRNAAIIQEIRSRASSFVCNFMFEGRAANRDVHKLAKYSLSLGPGRHIWLGQPQATTCIPRVVDFDE